MLELASGFFIGMQRLLSRLITVCALTIFIGCVATERSTDYKYNFDRDSGAGLSQDELHDLLSDGIGPANYEDLKESLGAETLDLLVYGTGISNLIHLVNEVLFCGGTADKLVDLISSTPSSPEKLTVETTLALLNSTDQHLRNEPVLPSGDDTIAKMANMVCKVNNMDDLIYIVNNTQDYFGPDTPPETEAISRVSLILALIDETEDAMPTVINEVADTTAGREKLLRLLSEVADLRKMAVVLNDTDELINLLTVIKLVDGTAPAPNGVDGLITTMNEVNKPEDLAYVLNQLSSAVPDINNDDGFENGDLSGQKWATSGRQVWYVDNGAANEGSFSARTNPAMADRDVASLELAANIAVAGNITFDFQTSTEAGDYLKFYIDDVLQGKWSGENAWQNDVGFAVTTGVHRFRWEYVKNASLTGGSDFVRIDDVTLPGDKGTARTAAEKTAIMLNQLDVTAQESVADILNGVNSDTYGFSGLDNLVYILNQVEYPLLITEEPRLVTIINDITNIDAMTELLRNLDANGSNNIVEVVDHSPDASQMAELINLMDSAGLGAKTTSILNGLTNTGAVNLAVLVDNTDNADLITLIDQADQVSHMSDILNGIYLHGSPGTETVGVSTGISGGAKMADVISRVNASASLSIETHLVRLINDIAGSALGPQAVGEMVGQLDPGAVNYPGTERMVTLMETLSAQSTPNYTNALSNATGDDFGRVIALMFAMDSNGAWNLSRIINELSCNDIGDPGNCRVYNASDLVVNSDRVVYVSRMITEMTNVQLVIDLMNDPATDFDRIQTMLNIVGEDTYGTGTIGTEPVHTYDNIYEWPSTDDDYLGRMVSTINNVAGSQGISNIIDLINGVTYTDGVTDNFSVLVTMIKDTHRVVYMSRLISDSTDLSLVIDLINTLDPTNPDEVDRLRTMINTFGDNTYGLSTGIGVDPSVFYTDAMDTSTEDEIGRMILFINDLNSEVQATGSSQAQAITNAVTMIMDSYDLNFIITFLQVIERIQYVTNMVAQIDNIGLMMTIINGESGDGSDGAEIDKLVRVMDNYGGSTRFGANPTGKAVGEMTMIADVIDILGAGRPISDQARMVTMVNNVIYCGIRPESDLTISGAGSPSDFFTCDTDVSFDYDSNKQNVVYDQRHRLSNVMLGLDDANTMAIIVGDVDDPFKTVRIMNGTRRINAIIKQVRWTPPEVTRDMLNWVNIEVGYTSLVYMINNLAPDEHEAAQAFTAMLHHGTGIAGGASDRNDPSKCKYYTGIGPKRMAELMNIEPGRYLEGVLQMFGWRSSIPSMLCAFGTPNASGTSQTVTGTLPYGAGGGTTGVFDDEERVYENYPNGGAVVYHYRMTDPDACHTYDYDCDPCDTWGCATCTNYGYMPEDSGALIIMDPTDGTIWNGMETFGVTAGLGGVWNVLKGEGFVGWLMQNGGTMAFPPTDPTLHGSPSCTDSSHSDEWSCIKVGKNTGDHISTNRWGNYCTINGYTSPGPCEAAGGRWMPDKHYDACFIDPETDAAYMN